MAALYLSHKTPYSVFYYATLAGFKGKDHFYWTFICLSVEPSLFIFEIKPGCTRSINYMAPLLFLPSSPNFCNLFQSGACRNLQRAELLFCVGQSWSYFPMSWHHKAILILATALSSVIKRKRVHLGFKVFLNLRTKM